MPALTHGRVKNGFNLFPRTIKYAQPSCNKDTKEEAEARKAQGYNQQAEYDPNGNKVCVNAQRGLCCGSAIQPRNLGPGHLFQRYRVPTKPCNRKFASTVSVGRSFAAKRAIARRTANPVKFSRDITLFNGKDGAIPTCPIFTVGQYDSYASANLFNNGVFTLVRDGLAGIGVDCTDSNNNGFFINRYAYGGIDKLNTINLILSGQFSGIIFENTNDSENNYIILRGPFTVENIFSGEVYYIKGTYKEGKGTLANANDGVSFPINVGRQNLRIVEENCPDNRPDTFVNKVLQTEKLCSLLPTVTYSGPRNAYRMPCSGGLAKNRLNIPCVNPTTAEVNFKK